MRQVGVLRTSALRAAAGVALLCGSAALLAGLGGSRGPRPVVRAGDMVQRGKYLVEIMGCADCHTPHDHTGREIEGRGLTGHPAGAPLPQWEPAMLEKGVLVTIAPTLTAFAGPFGVSIAPNLTPDKATGIGNMTAQDLIKSWREGSHWQTGQPIKPPMPWPALSKMTDEDIRAVHAYLMSLPAMEPAPLPSPAG